MNPRTVVVANKVLYVGDVHARPDCLDETQKLIDLIESTAIDEKVDYIVFLGDQFHTHSVIHLSVLGFWKRAFAQLANYQYHVYALVGNHDMSGRIGDENNALMLFDRDHVTVVERPTKLVKDVVLMPYYADHQKFVDDAARFPDASTLVCHQTFDGSKYENGFYAQDGIDPNLLVQRRVISGHIHTPQSFGKVWYPGSPRWQSIADANTERGIYVVDHATNSAPKMYSTKGVCRPIYTMVDREDAPAKLPEAGADVIVDVYGSREYVRARAAELEKLGARVRQFQQVAKTLKVKESDGLPVSFQKFIKDHKSKMGTSSQRLMELAQARISWLRA
jgi:DNA repair exonuclease SbcCD nuclease subunit